MRITPYWWTSIFGGGEKVGGSTSLVEHGSTVSISTEVIRNAINDWDLR